MAETSSSPTVHHIPEHAGKIGDLLKQKTAGLPNWAWLLVIAGGVAFAILAPKFFNKSNGGITDTSTTGNDIPGTTGDTGTPPPFLQGSGGGTVDLSGITDVLTQIEKNMQSTTDTTKDDTTDNTIKDTTTTKKNATTQWETIQPITSGWGAGAPSIPIRETPSGTGKIVGHIGYGKRVTVTGSSVNGTNNFGANAPKGVGSTKWYPVKGGYISAHDIEKISGTGSTGPSWPTSYMRNRHMQIGA